MLVAFETGSADWVNVSSESGFCKNKGQATVFKSVELMFDFLREDDRYTWLVEKGTIVAQSI